MNGSRTESSDLISEEKVKDPSRNPIAVEVKDVSKTFRIPKHRVESFKERAVHPLRKNEYRELKALDGISFDIHQGEFFGIVGRNGSGKSTLLKILASIYRADAGTIRMAGRLAPFIELGVGFNPDLTAYDNVVMNGVMMGLSRSEAASRLDRVIDFAELEEFTELKLKNYSSGMMVRLAFSLMVQADADILLIDEVLAVGDASFQQKCADTFNQMRDLGKTIVLVTHDMASVEAYCHRAMLIQDGEIKELGRPREVARAYFKLNFDASSARQTALDYMEDGEVSDDFVLDVDIQAKVRDSWLSDAAGGRTTNIEVGERLNFNVEIEALRDLNRPLFTFQINDSKHVQVTGFNQTLEVEDESGDRLPAGSVARISGTIENPLAPGRYQVICWVTRERETSKRVVQGLKLFEFAVFGIKRTPGLVEATTNLKARILTGDADE